LARRAPHLEVPGNFLLLSRDLIVFSKCALKLFE
jgi:hypothetical protein